MTRISILLPSLECGGAQVSTLELLRALPPQDFQIRLVTLDNRNDFGMEIPPHIQWISLGKRAFWDLFPPLQRLKRELRENPPELLLSVMAYSALWAGEALRAQKNTVRWVHYECLSFSPASYGWRFPLLRAGLKRYAARVDQWVAISAGIARDIERALGIPAARCRVIPPLNPLDRSLQCAKTAPPHHPSLSLRPYFFFGGRLVRQKGVDLLLIAYSQFLKTGDVHNGANKRGFVKKSALDLSVVHVPGLLIMGEGPEERRLKRRVKRLGLEGKVGFRPFSPDYRVWMKNAEALVLPSRYEGFGNVLVEAMAVGCPVIATDCPWGPAEILEQGASGMLIPPGDIPALARAMQQIADDGALRSRLIQKGLKRAEDFKMDRLLPEYLEVLRGL